MPSEQIAWPAMTVPSFNEQARPMLGSPLESQLPPPTVDLRKAPDRSRQKSRRVCIIASVGGGTRRPTATATKEQEKAVTSSLPLRTARVGHRKLSTRRLETEPFHLCQNESEAGRAPPPANPPGSCHRAVIPLGGLFPPLRAASRTHEQRGT